MQTENDAMAAHIQRLLKQLRLHRKDGPRNSPYPLEFKREVIALCLAGLSPETLAKQTGIPRITIDSWMAKREFPQRLVPLERPQARCLDVVPRYDARVQPETDLRERASAMDNNNSCVIEGSLRFRVSWKGIVEGCRELMMEARRSC